MKSSEVIIARKISFCCGLIPPEGSQSLPTSDYGLGYNFTLEAFFQGRIDPVSGLVINLTHIDSILRGVVELIDHKHLSFDVPDFESVSPCPENIAQFFQKKILEKIPLNSPASLIKVKLFQGQEACVEIQSPYGRGLQAREEDDSELLTGCSPISLGPISG